MISIHYFKHMLYIAYNHPATKFFILCLTCDLDLKSQSTPPGAKFYHDSSTSEFLRYLGHHKNERLLPSLAEETNIL